MIRSTWKTLVGVSYIVGVSPPGAKENAVGVMRGGCAIARSAQPVRSSMAVNGVCSPRNALVRKDAIAEERNGKARVGRGNKD